MKIGILAYCSACNFGAQLQLLSTYYYLQNNNHLPIIIDWTPEDLYKKYSSFCPKSELDLMDNERKRLWVQTKRCKTSEEVAKAITDESIDAVIIGSDAVAQHRALLERIKFPTRRLISITHPSSDTMFPNAFWGTFNDYLKENPRPIAVLSASSQDSRYKLFDKTTVRDMCKRVSQYRYVSVRDKWTQDMYKFITNGQLIPKVTPDPVFAFNQNVGTIIPSEGEIRSKYQLNKRYFIVSFHESVVPDEWIESFRTQANNKGYICVNLPYADKNSVGSADVDIKLPLSPLDWYSLIKYSSGYVGENMHPIVVSLHNSVPFFSFDNYGLLMLNGLITSEKSSKILHILKAAGLDSNRVSCISRFYNRPSASVVLNKIMNFDIDRSSRFSLQYYEEYKMMMSDILQSIK